MENQLDLILDNELAAHIDLGCKPVPSTSSSSSNVNTASAVASIFSKPVSRNSGKRKADDSISSQSKRYKASSAVEAAKPLADRVRPSSLDDVVGQTHLLGSGALLRNLIDRDAVGSLILWGPPGTGKTTLARVIAAQTKSSFREISATHTSAQELRKAFDEAANQLRLTGKKTLLFIDECQRLTKNIQDLFLPHIEAGIITCLLATTENPSFRLQNALLSRCRVFVLQKLTPKECELVLRRALRLYREQHVSIEDQGRDVSDSIDDDLLAFLAAAADGDARIALSTLELALKSGSSISKANLKESLLKAHLQYDRTGDAHYDTISALHKSIRGSDGDAALYWLARMLEGGEDPLYITRRMVRMAVEDVGLADPAALTLAMSTYQAVLLVGMPECDCIMAECAVYLAEAKKSVRVYKAYNAARALVKNEQQYPVPLHIRNAPTALMKKLDYGREYLYEPDYAHPVHQTFLPPELQHCNFLQDDDSFAGKQIDMNKLAEWETVHGGWSGRERLNQYLNRNNTGRSEGS